MLLILSRYLRACQQTKVSTFVCLQALMAGPQTQHVTFIHLQRLSRLDHQGGDDSGQKMKAAFLCPVFSETLGQETRCRMERGGDGRNE